MPRRSTRFAAAFTTLLCLTPLSAMTQPAEPAPAICSGERCEAIAAVSEALQQIRSHYAGEIDEARLVEAAINGMIGTLDPHSRYLGPDRLRATRERMRGEFGGLGLRLRAEDGVIKVIARTEGTPAFRAGIRPGDVITHLDGHPLDAARLSEAVRQIRGPLGSQVAMTIRRDGLEEPLEVMLTRAPIKAHPVRFHTEGRIGYIKIIRFNQQTQVGLEAAVDAIETELDDRLAGYVIDLRDNPGGLLTQAVSVADSFLDSGEIVSTRGRRARSNRRYEARLGDIAHGLPIAVLINSGSASAAEIVAAALQDHRRAVVLGTRSYGKGTVQTTMSLENEGGVKLTTARYYTPSGRSVHGLGVTPDIEVESDEQTGKQPAASPAPATSASRADEPLTRAIDMLCGMAMFEALDARRAGEDAAAEISGGLRHSCAPPPVDLAGLAPDA